jgi:2,4-dienoyl-CoA reductase-like NADH-dependent reductase (Old Yellow Enzyme family)
MASISKSESQNIPIDRNFVVTMDKIGEVATSLTLPSGLVLPNRLVKAAMAEQLAKNGQASSELVKVYEKWGEGGWGAIMTGKQLWR